MQVKALYDNGHLIFLDKALPPGTMEVTVDIPDDKIETLSPEWEEEIARRIARIDSGEEKLIPVEDVFKRLREKA